MGKAPARGGGGVGVRSAAGKLQQGLGKEIGFHIEKI